MNLLNLFMIPGLDNSSEIKRLREESKERMRKPKYIWKKRLPKQDKQDNKQ